MNREDIIRLADEADLWADQELQCIGEYHPDWHDVRDVRFGVLIAEQAKAEEREAIAQSLDKQADLACDEIDRQWAQEMAAAVRARSRT